MFNPLEAVMAGLMIAPVVFGILGAVWLWGYFFGD